MIRKLFWMVVLLLMTACTVFFAEGGTIVINQPTSTPGVCENCTVIPTDSVIFTGTSLPTEILEPAVEATGTESPSTQEPAVTPIPTQDLLPAATKTVVAPTLASTGIPSPTTTTPVTAAVYEVQPATPVFMQNFVHTDAGCSWQGIAGQVFDVAGNPVSNLIVKVSGTWNNAPVSLVGITGMVSGLPYGPGSYEIILGTQPFNTVDQLQIQVYSTGQTPLTAPLTFSTASDCTKNLVVINFKIK